MRIAVIHDYADMFRATRAYPRLAAHEVVVYTDAYRDMDKLVAQVSGCDALVLTNERAPLPREAIERLPQLKFVYQTSNRLDRVDVAACTERGIIVSVQSGREPGGASGTAELTWGLILASLRGIPYEVERMKQGFWQSTVGTRLYGKTLGIYAFGAIGSCVAQVGRAFGMKVVCWGREGSTQRAKNEGFEVAASREAFFQEADVLSLHLPLKKETAGIITAADLARMKPTALLVNTSRANIIAPGALVTALQQGRPGYAAVDVYEEEPVIGANHPLLKMENVVCTPHLGYAEQDKYENKYAAAVEQLLAFAEGRPVKMVNPEAAGKKR